MDRERLSQKTFERAINLLSYRARSVGEMRERLMEKPWAESEIVEEVILKLLNYGYLNDVDFAHDFAAARLRRKPMGRRVLQQKLALKKLSGADIEQALSRCFDATPEGELIEESIERRTRTRGLPKSREEARKLFDYLIRQGFSMSLVSDKIRKLGIGPGVYTDVEESI